MTDASAPVRVLLADDDDAVRRSIARLLSNKTSVELVGTAVDAEEAVDVGRRTQPDVALLDVRMPKGGGVRAARELRESSPETKVVALSGYADRDGVLEMLSTGAVGYLVKGANVDVVQGIMAASRGEGVISNELMADVIGELGGRLARQHEEEETKRLGRKRIETTIEHRAFEIAFQPVLNLRTGRIDGVEALARFTSEPYRAPDLWFQEAWRLGLGIDLELAAVFAAFDSARPLPPGVFLAVNVSPQTVTNSRFSELLVSKCCAESLVVELTEHAVVEDYDLLTGWLGPLRQSGVRVAVDDAGAGYASLRHVLLVKPDFIKLDISLVSDIDKDRAKLALAKSIVSFADESGTKVIAEGIESVAQLERVTELGVDYGQGYLLGRPSSFELLSLEGLDLSPSQCVRRAGPRASAPHHEKADLTPSADT
jgi:EAL domain-containing protein (putative c-di-GMP-specific phosphodiesterase class I)/ActR/RegA family two-component response regulator